jgi:hypothetical protein
VPVFKFDLFPDLQLKNTTKSQILVGNRDGDQEKNVPEESEQEYTLLFKKLSYKPSIVQKMVTTTNAAQDSIMSCLDDFLSNEI